MTGCEQVQLFNDLVGRNEEAWRDGEAECLGCFDVESRYELRRGLNRKVSGLGAAQNAVH